MAQQRNNDVRFFRKRARLISQNGTQETVMALLARFLGPKTPFAMQIHAPPLPHPIKPRTPPSFVRSSSDRLFFAGLPVFFSFRLLRFRSRRCRLGSRIYEREMREGKRSFQARDNRRVVQALAGTKYYQRRFLFSRIFHATTNIFFARIILSS